MHPPVPSARHGARTLRSASTMLKDEPEALLRGLTSKWEIAERSFYFAEALAKDDVAWTDVRTEFERMLDKHTTSHRAFDAATGAILCYLGAKYVLYVFQ